MCQTIWMNSPSCDSDITKHNSNNFHNYATLDKMSAADLNIQVSVGTYPGNEAAEPEL